MLLRAQRSRRATMRGERLEAQTFLYLMHEKSGHVPFFISTASRTVPRYREKNPAKPRARSAPRILLPRAQSRRDAARVNKIRCSSRSHPG